MSYFVVMVTEEPKDPLRRVNWKGVGSDMQKRPYGKPGIMKRLPRKISLNPDCYFLPLKLLPYNIASLEACNAVGYM
ncbi:hypothetical protein RchiOBHm_Chr1g0326231 [Rosa chinensis]|uniref:Uncharacterized protein n=1 Tax=Rosa chinensis TaxID=74649 RepID=A0A2P6SA80_ROSCH|nr:hypothetical protein RchiOBHm_Chr1g0326231 [Rosa chinensis]